MPANKKRIAIEYARMWPREVFDIMEEGRLTIKKGIGPLTKSGVYVLYRDEHPYYIGKAKKRTLFQRLHDHANKSTDKYFNLWNYFSAFVVDAKHIDEVEGILIAAMPTANSAARKIKQIRVPEKLAKILRKARQNKFNF
jgi:uncharacterized protein YyaL (SSP411 family)